MEVTTQQRAAALKEIGEQSRYIDGALPDGGIAVRLGLICTVYFRHGGKTAMGNRVLQCFDRFTTQFGQHLKGQFHDLSGRRFSTLRKDSIAKARAKLKANYVDEGFGFSWVLQSDPDGELAAEYSIKTLTAHAEMVDATLSYLKLQLPWRLLETPEGEQQFLDWVTYLCAELDIEQGYAGLACNVPYDYHLYQPYEFQVTQCYSGLVVDSSAHLDLGPLEDGIKSVSWLTLLGSRYIEALGGREALRQRLQLPDVEVQETENGAFIIRAGLLPSLGGQVGQAAVARPSPAPSLLGKTKAQAAEHPPAYVAVNRVLKPIRLSEANQDQLHTCMDDAEGYTKKTTAIWYARFDEPEATLETPVSHNKIPPSVPGGNPCPRAGRWATPAQVGSARDFKEGEIMPDFESDYGMTIWQWCGPSDDGKVR